MFAARSCDYCGEAAEHSCKGCSIASYCDRSHQQQDWKKHKRQCRTLKLVNDQSAGRYLIAGRYIKAGELLFAEAPIAFGPTDVSPLTCLGCHNPVTEEDFKICPRCSWPVCCAECANENRHAQECQLLQRDTKRSGVPQKQGETPRYDLILIIRCLLLRSNNPSAWRKLQAMESHLQRRKTDVESHHMAAVRFLMEICKVDFDIDIVHHVRGAIITNCYETKGPSETNLRGVYPILGLINHSCIPNITLRTDKAGDMFVRASVAIEKGETLSVAYTSTTTPIWERSTLTRELHYFSCKCPRCESLSELDTFFSSPKCPACRTIALIVDKGREIFYCSRCCHQEPMENIIEMCNATSKTIDSFYEDFETKSITGIRKTIQNIEETYHKMNYLWMQTAQLVIRVLTNRYDVDALKLKKELWEDLLAIFNVIEAGKTRRRGMTLLELGMTEYALLEKENDRENLSRDSLKAKLENLKLLSEAEEILKLEPPDSNEFQWLEKAKLFLRSEGVRSNQQ